MPLTNKELLEAVKKHLGHFPKCRADIFERYRLLKIYLDSGWVFFCPHGYDAYFANKETGEIVGQKEYIKQFHPDQLKPCGLGFADLIKSLNE